jgi:lipopolysaccharide transport system ATP-binding protein
MALHPPPGSILWALRDIDLKVHRGEILGIVGRNGAGKTTLLKLLSRITSPTSGQAWIRGRVGCMLEVGAGFHPELTGRENTYLSGAVLGMKKADIARHFDEIVAFAELEQFIDTPVKRYSSGMYVRLAFAVAAHLRTEIVLLDEVLAVGDVAFQRRCLEKVDDVAGQGRTVLFVSHNPQTIKKLCTRAMWLDQGRLQMIGDVDRCIAAYFQRGLTSPGRAVFDPPLRLNQKAPVVLHSVAVADDRGREAGRFSVASSLRVSIDWGNLDTLYRPRIGFVLATADGIPVMKTMDALLWDDPALRPGRRRSACVFPGGVLNEGEYVIVVGADSPQRFDFGDTLTGALVQFELEDDMRMPNKYYGQEGYEHERWVGTLLIDVPWTQEPVR